MVQFERLGYFAHDQQDPLTFHRTVGLRDEWANLQKRQANSADANVPVLEGREVSEVGPGGFWGDSAT